jgi:hypothetical protein
VLELGPDGFNGGLVGTVLAGHSGGSSSRHRHRGQGAAILSADSCPAAPAGSMVFRAGESIATNTIATNIWSWSAD